MPPPRRVQKRQLNGRQRITKVERVTTGETNVLDLNDHCIREVFNHLELTDLVYVADVCSRFRYNARAHFATSKHTKLYLEVYGAKSKHLGISKTMRNFGAFATSISLFIHCGISDSKLHPIATVTTNSMRKHCTEKLTILNLTFLRMSAKIIRLLRPLFCHLKTLSITRGEALGLLMENFPELESFSMAGMKLNGNDFADFLRRNSQLKEIAINNCDEVNGNILRSIATHVPQIETVHIDFRSQKGGTFQENQMYLCKMNKLKNLGVTSIGSSFASTLNKIAKAKVPLEYLQLETDDVDDAPNRVTQYINGISELSKLKRLVLCYNMCLNATDVLQICGNLRELRELIILCVTPALSADHLVELIRNGEQLEKIFCSGRGDIMDVDTYLQMVEILKRRRVMRHLTVYLWTLNTGSTNIPEEMIKKNAHILTLNLNHK